MSLRHRPLAALLLLFLAGAVGLRPLAARERADWSSRPGRLVWRPELRVKRAEKVFPSPHDPGTVFVATRRGLMRTRDGAQNWALLPRTGRAELGRISDLLFAPGDPSLLLLGSQDKGIFRSKDGGRSWQALGSKANGLESLQVARLAYYPGDPSLRTLYATHGEDGAGISKSIDGGKTWFTIAKKYYCSELLCTGTTLFMAGVLIEEGDVWGIFRSTDGGRYWSELLRDVRANTGALDRLGRGNPYFGLNGGRIVVIRGGEGVEGYPVGPEKEARWQSLFSTYGVRADEEWLYAYDPNTFGVLATKDKFENWWRENQGLYVGPLVKAGANVRASANGRTLYASINGQLYVGRPRPTRAPYLSRLKADPAVVRLPFHGYVRFMGGLRSRLRKLAAAPNAGRLAVKMRAQLALLKKWTQGIPVSVTVHARGPAKGGKIKQLYADLSPLLGSPKTPLLDDGKHGDGAPGDGVYGATITVTPRCLASSFTRNDRPVLPGRTALTVTAVNEQGKSASGVVVFSAYRQRESMVFWNGEDKRWGANMTHQGEAKITESEKEPRSGERALNVSARNGPWSCAWGVYGNWWKHYRDKNVSDEDYLVFWIRVPPGHQGDIKVGLQDGTDHFTATNRSHEVWLLKDGYLKSLKDAYQLVRIPMRRLLKRTAFFADLCGAIVFSGEGTEGHEFYVDDIGFEIEGEPVPAAP